VRGTAAQVGATIAVHPISLTDTRSSDMPWFQCLRAPDLAGAEKLVRVRLYP
jgi:hypothetical protein